VYIAGEMYSAPSIVLQASQRAGACGRSGHAASHALRLAHHPPLPIAASRPRGHHLTLHVPFGRLMPAARMPPVSRFGMNSSSSTLSSPQSRRPDGGVKVFDDFREAYGWLRHNTAPDAKVASWWDYGYQTTAMSNRTVIVDNNTWNNTHIATGAPPRHAFVCLEPCAFAPAPAVLCRWLALALDAGWLAPGGRSAPALEAPPAPCALPKGRLPCPRAHAQSAAPWPPPRRRRGRSSAAWMWSTCLSCLAGTSGEHTAQHGHLPQHSTCFRCWGPQGAGPGAAARHHRRPVAAAATPPRPHHTPHPPLPAATRATT
jgi:hypothetical protein